MFYKRLPVYSYIPSSECFGAARGTMTDYGHLPNSSKILRPPENVPFPPWKKLRHPRRLPGPLHSPSVILTTSTRYWAQRCRVVFIVRRSVYPLVYHNSDSDLKVVRLPPVRKEQIIRLPYAPGQLDDYIDGCCYAGSWLQ